ncbi:MAG: leucine-rich repeat protein, partial [Clostridia bacterium]|nr:leucine-rich repeat protein [Clostridia bacterium]
MTRMNTLTKLLCAVLVLCGLLCCAGAAGAEGDCAHVFTDGACTACGVTGGYCGASTNEGGEQSVTWTLSDNHLVISGEGAMVDYASSGVNPWYDVRRIITDVTIGDGVTRIGKFAFYNFRSVPEIIIPASVESIGYEAFGNSTVSSVTFAPNSRLTTIDDYAFQYLTALKQITLPASVETIGNRAFESCNALETVTFAEGSRLSSIGHLPFGFCDSLTAISVPESVTAYKTIDGVLYSGDGTALLCYPAGRTDPFTTPAGVTAIAEGAFVYAKVPSVTLSEGVTTLGTDAFASCRLQSVRLPDTLTSIGEGAFGSCFSLVTVSIPASVTSIGEYAFGGCDALTTVNAPCTWDGSLYTFEDTVTVNAILHRGGTANCEQGAVCDDCGEVYTDLDPDNHTYASDICCGTCGAEGDGTNLSWMLKDNHLFISGTGAMADYSSSGWPWDDASKTITDVTIGDGVTHIGKHAFCNFCALTEITIPASVESIGYQAFRNSTVSSVTFAPNSRLTTIDGYAFSYLNSLKQITLPASVETIGAGSFESCTALETVTFAEGSRLSSLGYMPFFECNSLTAISIPESATACKTIDGVLYSGDGTTLLLYPAGKTDEAFTTPTGVTTIAEFAFFNTQLHNITLSEGVTTIGNSAFFGCYGMQSVSLPSTLTSIGNTTFAFCNSLTTVTIPASVSSIGDSAFESCYGLTTVTIPASVTSIGSNAFASCYDLTTVNVPCNWDGSLYTFADTVTVNVPGHAFADGECTGCGVTGGYCGAAANAGGEQSVVWTYKDGVMTITGTGDMAEYDSYEDRPWYTYCNSITALTIQEGVTTIGRYAFEQTAGLKNVTIPASVTKLGYCAFRGSGLETVTFADESQLTTIDSFAFQLCDELTEITLPAGVGSFRHVTVFDDCSALTDIHVAEGNTTYKDIDGVLYTADGTTLMFYPEGKTATSFATPAGVTTIGQSAFRENGNIKSVTLSEGVTTIGEQAFLFCGALAEVTIPASVKSIGVHAFYGCEALTTVNAPCNWDGSLYTFADTVTVNVPEHTGGTANCQSGAICDACGEAYGELDYDVHANTEVVWEWYPNDDTVSVYAELICADCEAYIMSTSGEGEFLGEVEPTDCKNPGSMSYSATLTFKDGTEVSGTHTVTIPSENHVGPMSNGFCAACGGFEKPGVDPGEYEDETWDDTYLISNAGQLYWFANEVNGGNNGIGARLTANITVPASVSKGGSIPDWEPIGQGYTPYCGTFNGGGHTISGLYCVSNRAGLFGYTDYHYNIRNIGVVNGTFIGSDYAGALVGYASSNISGCWASGNTIEGNYAGGLVGQNIGTITGSRATGNTVEGSLAGGLVGYNNNGTIGRSYGTGNTVTGDSAGGLVGENYGTVENSYSTGNSTGYLVGYGGGPITNCFTDGSALFRDSYGDVTNSYYVAASATDDGGRTAAQFESGEIAWLLQSAIEPEEVYDEETGEWVMADAALIWGQSIGSASYPALGGKRVYQVLSCDGEGTAYSNTDEQQKHSVINDVCANCGLFCPHDTGNGGICSICGTTVERSMVILPASLTAVEAEAFTDTAVEAVVIPAGCTSIAAGAFSGC